VAVKGLGGFHLMVAAEKPASVARLRKLKFREEKPFALMVSSVAAAREFCEVGPIQERLLCSPEAPIVLLRRIARGEGARRAALLEGLAPGNPYLGVMLPTTALHHLLMREVGGPVIATSGNLRDEPTCIDEREARERLGGIADLLLVHDRPIVRRVDDSVVCVVLGRELVLRRARGYVPLPITVPAHPAARGSILAVGGHLKNTVALSVGSHVFLSQHIGDLETVEALESHHRIKADLEKLHQVRADCVATDAHAGYASSRAAASQGQPIIQVQHHFAHLLSCMAENGLTPPVLGVIWDGTGEGLDGTIWGGEFLVAREKGFTREGWLRTFPLPGGESAIREPRRAALGLLHEVFGEELWEMKELATLQAFTARELNVLRVVLKRSVNAPRTSSVGRLFDAIASMAGVRQISRYEGQAAMELEFAAEGADTAVPSVSRKRGADYVLSWKATAVPDQVGNTHPASVADWGDMVRLMVDDLRAGAGPAAIARRFHEALAGCVVPVARRVGLEHVALSGGCFQNRLLTEMTVDRLNAAGFRPCWHRRVPPNDGGLALGQVMAAMQAVA
jgi:hydrogenase maturation protein HypF